MNWERLFWTLSSLFWLVTAMLFACAAFNYARAEQASVLCKTVDTNEYIDIVAKGEKTNEVLVQISGGKFFDGISSFENPVFKVFVEFENGKMALIYNVKTQDGSVGMLIGEEKQLHNIICKFRG